MIVTVTGGGDGTAVRWYSGNDTIPNACLASATTTTVDYVEDAPVEVRDAADAAHRELARDAGADMRHYATHIIDGGLLVPVRDDTGAVTKAARRKPAGKDSADG